eukprot:scaffold81874_cov50-Cyclotella_meneghiniana.AAC.2
MGQHQYVIIAVSGTIQDGFELRKNIDYVDENTKDDNGSSIIIKAIFIGWAMVRGVKMYLDVKDEVTSREYDVNVPHRVNPALVLTGDAKDANRYAVYAVDERACLEALLGEPRMLTMTPDSVRIDLNDPLTSPEVAAITRTMMKEEEDSCNTNNNIYQTGQCTVLAVVACYKLKSFIPAPPYVIRNDGTRVTSFQQSLSLFAGLNDTTTTSDSSDGPSNDVPGTVRWNEAVASALEKERVRIATGGKKDDNSDPPGALSPKVNDDSMLLYGSSRNCFRLSRRIAASKFKGIAQRAGLSI